MNRSYESNEQCSQAVIDEDLADVDTRDLLAFIESKLTSKQKELLVCFRNGEKHIPTETRRSLEDAIAKILDECGLSELAERIIQ